MDPNTTLLIALIALVLLAIAFFAVFRGKGKVQLDTKLGKLKAEGENPPPPTAIPAGVSASGARAEGDVRAHSASAGGVNVDKASAGGKLTATHEPGNPLPKP